MNKYILYVSLLIISCFFIKTTPNIVRLPSFAGLFYPQDQKNLIQTIKNLEQTITLTKFQNFSEPKILIVPHAGYPYSGPIAMQGYATIKDQPIETFIIIGPYHKENFSGVSIWTEGTWQTPLGNIAIDEQLAKAIQKHNTQFNYKIDIHNQEHSLEVQIPLIQYFFPNARIVPVLISDLHYAQELANALYKTITTTKKSIALIFSTDMSHYHNQETAYAIDSETIEILKKSDASLFFDSMVNHKSELCGAAAVQTALLLAKKLKNRNFVLYNYQTSGDITKSYNSVVGYVTAGLTERETSGKNDTVLRNPSYSKEEQKQMLSIARTTLIHHVTKKEIPQFNFQDQFLKKEKGVFITLWKNKTELRGCIGTINAQKSLLEAIIHMTINAASNDSRFEPVTAKELDSITIEISVLSRAKPIESIDQIIFKKHGVIISNNNHQGVFLPEVAENFSTKEDFLNALCTQKAGLAPLCWKDKDTAIKIFATESFKE